MNLTKLSVLNVDVLVEVSVVRRRERYGLLLQLQSGPS